MNAIVMARGAIEGAGGWTLHWRTKRARLPLEDFADDFRSTERFRGLRSEVGNINHCDREECEQIYRRIR